MDSPATPRSPWALTFAITIGFMVALVIGGTDLYFKTTILERGDIAVNALQIDNARHGTEIYGNYSRFGFNHPGPAYFYAYAGGEIVLHDWLGLVPSPHNAHLLTSLFIQVSCFALAVAILHCWIGSWTFVALALLGGVWHFSLARDAFTSIWPPHVLLMPFLAFIASASSLAAGRTRDLAIMVVIGGFLFHGHVAQPLFVGGIGGLSLFLYYRHLQSKAAWTGYRNWLRGNRGMTAFCGISIGLFLLPLLIDMLRFGLRGNVSTIIHQFLVKAEGGKNAWQSLLYFLSFPTYAHNQEDLFTKLGPASYAFFRDHWLILSAWSVFLILPGAFAFWHRTKLAESARRILSAGYPVWGVTVVLCLVWGMMQAGPMFQFNGYFFYGVYYFAALLSLGVVCSIPGRLFPVPVTAALCGVAGISASWLFRAPRLNEDEQGLTLQRGIDAALKQDTSRRPKLLVFEHYAWPEAASVALDLQRRGISFSVAPNWDFMFGRQHNLNSLGTAPEAAADIWWVAGPGPGSHGIGNGLYIFTQPALVDPRNTVMDFSGRANGFRHLIYGLSVGNTEFAWTEEPQLALKFRPLPAIDDVQVLFDVDITPRRDSPSEQKAEVFFNEQLLGTLTVTKPEKLGITIPRELWNSAPVAILKVHFTDATRWQYFSKPARDIWSAWALWSIRFQTPPAK